MQLPGIRTEEMTDGEDLKALSEVLDDIIFRARYLRAEVNNMERMVDVLNSIGILDEALRVYTGELPGICTDCVDVTKTRKRLEAFVRETIVYDSSKYASYAEYDRRITAETERRVLVSGTTASSVITAVVSSLRRSGVLDPSSKPVTDDAGRNTSAPPPTCPAHKP